MSTNKKHPTSIRLPNDLYERVKYDADSTGQTLTHVILENLAQNYALKDVFDLIHATHKQQNKCLHDILQLLHNLKQEQKNASGEIQKLKKQVSTLTMGLTQIAKQVDPGQSKEGMITKLKKAVRMRKTAP